MIRYKGRNHPAFELKKSVYDKEVETARAQAELAFQLQTAKVRW